MSISIQLVEIPENEQVVNRQISLPEAGGTIGRGYDCTLQLPDFDRQLSRVHVEIARDAKGLFQVFDRSTNGLFVNGKLLGKGRHQPLGDGDALKLGGYVLLISDMESLFSEPAEALPETAESSERREPVFSLDNLNTEVADWPLDAAEPVVTGDVKEEIFSRHNVLADDQFGCDPFDDELEMKQPQAAVQSDVVHLEHSQPAETHQLMKDGLTQLNKLMEQQQRLQMEPSSHDKLMDCLHRTLDRFLEDLHPSHMEDTFDDYISGWGGKDKKYWRLYRKQFIRKLDRKEFHRQFSALFVEELRGKG